MADAVTRRPHPVVPLVALAVVATLDWVAGRRHWSVPVVAVLDEPAHLITAWLVLVAVSSRLARPVQLWALLGAVVIDLDHVPLYLWWALLAEPDGRPVTHSLATVVVLVALGAVPRLRVPALGLALGVLLHLARDLATGPGVPLLWPLVDRSVQIPYTVYAVALTVTAVIAALWAIRADRSRVSG